VKPGADAVIVADPVRIPLICGAGDVHVFRAGINTDGVTATVDGSLLVRDTVTPPAGAGTGSVIWSAAD
jgi:hypothetical protein